MPQVTVYATDDAEVRAWSPNTNFGNDWNVRTGKSGGLRVRGFYRFPIPVNPAIPGTITKVTFYGYGVNPQGAAPISGTPTSLDVYLALGTVDQASITWNNKPTLGAFMGGKAWPIGGIVWHAIDITANFPGWNQDLNIGMILNTESAYNNLWANLSSIERPDFKTPYIVIEYLDDAPTPSTAALNPQSADKEKNTVSWTEMPEPDFQKYEIWRSKDGAAYTLVQSGAVQTWTSWDDPLVLVDGSTYDYFVRSWDTQNQTSDSNIVSMTKPEVTALNYNTQTPLVGETVQGTITANGGIIVNYYWDWDDGTPYWTGSNTDTHEYSGVGTYDPLVRAENDGGWWSGAFAGGQITVQSQKPVARLHTIPSGGVVDIGEPIILDGSESFDQDIDGQIDVFEFDPGTGSFSINNGLNPKTTISFTEYGTYLVRLKVTDDSLDTDIATATILVAAQKIIGLMFYYPVKILNRQKLINFDEASKFSGDGIDMEPTGSGAIVIDIGAKCQGDDGELDIIKLQKIRDAEDVASQVQITIEGKDYVGELTNIIITKITPAPEKTWDWKAQLKIPKPPGD